MKNRLRPHLLPLRPRFVIIVLAGVALVASAMAVASYHEASEALLRSTKHHMEEYSLAKATEIARRLGLTAATPLVMATSFETAGLPREGLIIPLLERHIRRNPGVFGMALAFAPGQFRPGVKRYAPYVCRTPDRGLKAMRLDDEKYDYLSQGWYLIPSLLGRPYWSEPYFDQGGGGVLMTTFSVPVFRQAKLKAVLTADVNLRDLGNLARDLTEFPDGFVFILTRHGTFLVAPEEPWVMRETIFSLAERLGDPGLRKLGKRMLKGERGVAPLKHPITGEDAWMAFAPVADVGWSFGIVAPEGRVLEPVVNLAQHQFWWAGMGLLVMAVVVLLLVLSLTHPIQLLIQGVRRLASGNLDTRVEGVRPGDEVGEMADAFNNMASDLSSHIEELKRKKAEVERALEKVALLENIQDHLNKFVPQSVRRIITDSPEAPHLEKRELDVSVLFLDIEGYTRLSEGMAPGELNFLLESYFSSFLDDIYNNKGDINETAGDGLMIIFQGEDPKVNAVNAVKTALAIRGKVADVNMGQSGTHPPVTVNIGINSGRAMVGSSRFEGLSGDRWTFTATGPVTNIAARIGALATEGRIFIGPETAKRVEAEFELIDLGPMELKNVSAPVRVSQVLGSAGGRHRGAA